MASPCGACYYFEVMIFSLLCANQALPSRGRRAFRFFYLVAGCFMLACIYSPKSSSNLPDTQIHTELLDDFLKSVCTNLSEDDFIRAWDDYEKRNWAFYSGVYYPNEKALEKRENLMAELKSQGNNICRRARAFRSVGEAVVKKAARDVIKLTGFKPSTQIFFAAAFKRTDANGIDVNGGTGYVLNGAHDNFGKTSRMVDTITHELVHGSFYRKYPQKKTGLPSIPAVMFWEGAAMFAVTVLYPEIGENATGLNSEELALAHQYEARTAQDILPLWEQATVDPAVTKKLFSGKTPEDGSPQKIGYFIGLKIFQRLAAKYGTVRAINVDPAEFKKEGLAYLEGMASPALSRKIANY